jgi:hypothetical protein
MFDVVMIDLEGEWEQQSVVARKPTLAEAQEEAQAWRADNQGRMLRFEVQEAEEGIPAWAARELAAE